MEFADGSTENFDAIILATGYKSNVPYWLKVSYSYNPIMHSLKIKKIQTMKTALFVLS